MIYQYAIFLLKTILPKCVYKTKHPDRNFLILKRVTGDFTLW